MVVHSNTGTSERLPKLFCRASRLWSLILPTGADNTDIFLVEVWEMNLGRTGETLESLNMIFPVCSATLFLARSVWWLVTGSWRGMHGFLSRRKEGGGASSKPPCVQQLLIYLFLLYQLLDCEGFSNNLKDQFILYIDYSAAYHYYISSQR